MLRFAPSPTGDMQISDLRVALLNYIVAKQRDEDFIIRIEDIETSKNIEGKDQEILDLLDLFHIKHAQVVYQSQNVRFHSAMALQLTHERKAFSCFCSWEWIENKRKEAEDANKEYLYDDACRDLSAELVIDNTNPFTIRIDRPSEDIVVHDLLKGDITFKADTIDSFMLLGQDKAPRYIFASAVDDMLNDISLVIRDEKHLQKTPQQEYVRSTLKYDKKIEYAHLPTISNVTYSVKELLSEGYLPEAISNYLVSIGNKVSVEIFNLEDAVEWLELESISDSPVNFDIEVLKEINKEHLKNLDAKELSRYVGFADSEIGELARLYLDKASTTKELKSKIEPIFTIKNIPNEFTSETKLIAKIFQDAPYFEEYEDFKNYMIKESRLEDERFSKALYLLFTGASDGPDIVQLYKCLKNYIGEIIK